MSEQVSVTLSIPKADAAALRRLVEMDDFSSVSEAVRTAVRDMIYDKANDIWYAVAASHGGYPT